jgi:hypothetical protein
MKKKTYALLFTLLLLVFSTLISACGAPATAAKATATPTPQPTPTLINKNFQSQLSPIPALPRYTCGAWASNRSPGMYSTITIYAKLTHDVQGVAGAPATGVVHFDGYDAPLGSTPISDKGGYVIFYLPLQGRQPHMIPATIDITFTVQGKVVACSQAFFTPA